MMDRNGEILLNIGFQDIGRWRANGDNLAYEIDRIDAASFDARLDDANALYAFVLDGSVSYIGKTARSIRTRCVGYCRPGATQSTNIRCNKLIRDALAAGGDVRILIFTPITHFRYGDFEINLAAGLEDSLIKSIDPPWNGRERDQPISEEAEREKEEARSTIVEMTRENPAGQTQPQLPKTAFEIVLGPTYYEKGLINPGMAASSWLGRDAERIIIEFDDGSPSIVSVINRTANASGAVRVVGRNQEIARWFQRHFCAGDIVKAQILDKNRIRLLSAQSRSS